LSDFRDDIFIADLFSLRLMVKYIIDDNIQHILRTYIQRVHKN